MWRLGMVAVGVSASLVIALLSIQSVSYAGPVMRYQGTTTGGLNPNMKMKVSRDSGSWSTQNTLLSGEWHADFTGDVSSSIFFNELTFRASRQALRELGQEVRVNLVIDAFDFKAESVGPLATSIVDVVGDLDVFVQKPTFMGNTDVLRRSG